MIIFYTTWTVLLIIILLFLRIRLITKEIEKTGKVKKRGFIEYLLHDHIEKDIERKKMTDYTETREKSLKLEILRNTEKN